ncbi:hypothetical protein [Streptomyces sp. AC602_WCS936]|uniref:hypothetical protein n=1 Tax=Streptomyces sp. AC602_WCS936 TaxID=2823685 RepID=UPI001C2779C8|nr:hypothetical protein [Streptomyces sp. AC602_WCS936]
MEEQQSVLEELLEPVQAEMEAFRKEVITVRLELSALRSEQEKITGGVLSAGHAVEEVRQTVDTTHETLTDFVERYGRHQVVANAQAELTQLIVMWKADFAGRRRVRALARGLTNTLTNQAVTKGLVDRETVHACVREQFLTEPTYWLAPAVAALAARHLCEQATVSRATAHAMYLDSDKSKLFLALTCSRLGLLSEAAGWMDRYLNSLDRDDLGPEFAVLLEAIANSELGYDAYTYAREAVTRWFREDRAAFRGPGTASAGRHAALWSSRLMKFGGDPSGERFAVLRELAAAQWPTLARGWVTATALEGALEYLRSLPTAEEGPSGRDFTHTALDHLIDQEEPDEEDVRLRMARLRALIKCEGDEEAAAAAVAESARGGERLDFVTLLERAVFQPDELGMGASARRLALECVWESVRLSALSMAQSSGSSLPPTVTLSVEDWSCDFPTDPVRVFDVGRAAESLVNHVELRTHEAIDSIVPTWWLIGAAGCLAILDGLVLIPRASGPTLLTLSTVMVLLVLVAVVGVAHAPFRRRIRREAGERQRTQAGWLLVKAVRELEVMLAEWRSGIRSSAALEGRAPGPEKETA